MNAHLLAFFVAYYVWFSRAVPLPQEHDSAFRNLEIVTRTTTIPLTTTFTEVVPSPTFTPPSSFPFTIADQPSADSSDSAPLQSISPASPAVITDVVTVYSTLSPPTITEVVVPFTQISVTTLAASPSTQPAPYPSNPLSPAPSATWASPADFSNLDCWNITKFADGKDNIQVVRGIPASASATSSLPVAASASATPSWSNDTSAIQIRYPKDSVNPQNSPQGGAEFYATPLPEMLSANNVSLEYSVFFPADFQWVKGGKLPGLYGGHYGCSGGDAANSCFSTRLMWRPNGMGELYLYVDKSNQPVNLCDSTPFPSECNPQYGLSLSRGSFNFTPGSWTHVKQTVRLNTPGVQDGGFTLDANGVRVLTLEGIFYRGTKESGGDADTSFFELMVDQPPAQAAPSGAGWKPNTVIDVAQASTGEIAEQDETMLLLVPPEYAVPSSDGLFQNAQPSVLISRETYGGTSALDDDIGIVPVLLGDTSTSITSSAFPPAPTSSSSSSAPSALASSPPAPRNHITSRRDFSDPQPAFGFSGIFFSTFFGGHDPSWASPVDQYAWFKDFKVSVNA